ncbi:MAG TPA: molybdopterin cofactor-binding domain-containing protein [Methylomirabilota bacterium]|jgi:4-hydroxybenzoyl-CoA reductase alpha subunit|nr:molybdopterin cofactor-binding domain-containing protein [Methylomirabilota bacterium]
MSDGKLSVVGKPLPKVDAWAKVTGETKFADDLTLPRMTYAKILRAQHPHALIKRIDTSQAEALPGVYAVITGRDFPPVKFGIMPVSQDEEPLCVEKVRYVGDPVAAVAAVDEETAEQAMHLIEVEYETLPPLMSIDQALKAGSHRIQEYGDGHNIHKLVSLEFGDVEEGFREADLVREDVFFFEGNTHLPMEQHAAVAQSTLDGKLTLWSSTQTPHYVHRALGKVLQLPLRDIRVIATPNGGGFGGKSDPFSHEMVVCRLAQLTGRPVKTTLTREEVFYAHRGRHPVLMWIKSGVRRDGAILAIQFRSYLDGGAYGSYGVASTFYTGALQTVTYKVPRYKFEGCRVFTNKPPCGPKRGHGTPQPRFALEVHLDKIAEQLGLDPAEMRRRHAVDEHTKTVNHLTITTSGLRECLDRVVEASGWREKFGKLPSGRGVGLAASSYISGAGLPIYWNDMPHSGVVVKIDRGGGVAAFCGSIDIGQGSDSVLAYVVAEVLGIRPEDIRVVTADTDLTPVDLGSYSSRVTLMTGNAAKEAAEKLRGLLLDAAAKKLEVSPADLEARDRRIFVGTDPAKGLAFDEAARLAEAAYGTLVAAGSYTPPKRAAKFKGAGVGPTPAYSYSACVVELEVDPDTAEIRIDRIWIAHDGGTAINPLLVEGQVEGSVYMGLGEALMEEQVFRHGVHKIPSMLEYKSPTTLETPEITTILVQTHDAEGPFGAKEAGQGPLLPVIPAIANAVYDAVGVRIDEIPITPEKILKALDLKAKGRPPRVGPERLPDVRFPEPIRVPPPWVDSEGRAATAVHGRETPRP